MTIESRSLGFDPETGLEEVFHYDHGDDSITIERRQDLSPILEHNKARANAAPSGWKGEWHHCAQIPLVILADLDAKGITSDPKRFKKWLNDRDNRLFRTKDGHL